MAAPWEKYATPQGPWQTYQPPAAPETFDPTEGMSAVDRVLAGSGKAMTDLIRGIGNRIGLVSDADIAESRRLDKALMNTTGGTVGNVIGNMAMLAPTALIPGANTVTGAATIGALTGLAQPSLSTTETAANVLFGGAGGAAGQKVASKLAGFAQGTRQTPAQQQSAASATKLGFEMTPGQATGSPALQKIEAAMESHPMFSRPFDRLRESNQQSLNRAAAAAIGENSDNVGREVLERASDRMGQVFSKVADGTPVPLDPISVGARVRQVLDDSEGMIGGNASLADNALFKRLDAFVNEAGGASREQLRNLSSKLGKAGYNNMTSQNGDRALGEALFSLKSIVDEQVLNTLQGAERKQFADAMKQYADLMKLTGRVGVINPDTGNVSGRGLANLLQQKDRQGYLFGKNNSDLYNAARFYKAFPDVVGNSGTATRSLGPTDWLTALPGNLLSSAYLSGPSRALLSGTHGGTGAAAGLLGRGPIALPGGVMSGLGAAGLLAPYLEE